MASMRSLSRVAPIGGRPRRSGLGSLGMSHPAKPRKQPSLGANVRYWNKLPDTQRYTRAKKFGRVPINPGKLKRGGYKVFEDFSIGGGKRRR